MRDRGFKGIVGGIRDESLDRARHSTRAALPKRLLANGGRTPNMLGVAPDALAIVPGFVLRYCWREYSVREPPSS